MPKKPPLPTITHARLPQYGEIEGGLLHGWRFGLDAVEVDGDAVFLLVNATRPNWPFPTLVRLNARSDFTGLRNLGEQARYLDSQKLIEAAAASGT